MASELEFNDGYLVTQIKKLERENLRISKLNSKYEKSLQIEISSENFLQDIQDSLEIVNTHCSFLKSLNTDNHLIKKHVVNLEFTINTIIDKISKNLENQHHKSEDFFKNKVGK